MKEQLSFATTDLYCLDTCILIDCLGKESHKYPVDLFPNVMQTLEYLYTQKQLISSEEVLKELKRHSVEGDLALTWAKEHRDIFKPVTAEQINFSENLEKRFINQFKDNKNGADAILVSQAVEFGGVVISSENDQTGDISALTQAKIPTLCRLYNIKCYDIVDLCRAVKVPTK